MVTDVSEEQRHDPEDHSWHLYRQENLVYLTVKTECLNVGSATYKACLVEIEGVIVSCVTERHEIVRLIVVGRNLGGSSRVVIKGSVTWN
jgi:hypothetical protein